MNKKVMLLSLMLALLLALSPVAMGCPPPPVEVVEKIVPWPGYPEPQFVWRVQTVSPAGIAVWYEPFLAFVERVRELSRGRLVIEPFPCGAIVGPFEVFDAVVAGVFEGFHSWPSYWVGKEPAFTHFSGMVMSLPEQWMVEAWYWEGGGIELARELYAKFDLFYVGPVGYGTEIMQFVRPVYGLACFDGMLFRTPAGITADFVAGMGASIVILPGGEIFTAVELGVIEGFEWCPLPINYPMGFHLVAPYFIHPGFHLLAGATEFVVHMDHWNALPPYLQEIVVAAVREWSAAGYHRLRIDEAYYLARMLAAGNVWLPPFPEEDMAEIRQIAVGVWEEWAAKSPFSARVVESKLDFKRHLGVLD